MTKQELSELFKQFDARGGTVYHRLNLFNKNAMGCKVKIVEVDIQEDEEFGAFFSCLCEYEDGTRDWVECDELYFPEYVDKLNKFFRGE